MTLRTVVLEERRGRTPKWNGLKREWGGGETPGLAAFRCEGKQGEGGGRRRVTERVIKGERGERSFGGVRLEWAESSQKAPVGTARCPLESACPPSTVTDLSQAGRDYASQPPLWFGDAAAPSSFQWKVSRSDRCYLGLPRLKHCHCPGSSLSRSSCRPGHRHARDLP